MHYNMLFKGDNLEVLNALKKTHENAVKCVYLDPPYNTGVNRRHFNDDITTGDWIQMMRKRLLIIRTLMREDASLWISIDDSELCNLKHLCNEIFGKENFLAIITWQHQINWDGYRGKFQLDHSYIVSYRKSQMFSFENNLRPKTVWLESEVGGHKEALNESRELFGEANVFSTPKPEKLLSYIIELTTKKDEILLDGFSGSGTAGAAAQKMGRRWIMMEIGQQCETHILPRMNRMAPQIDPYSLKKQDKLDGFVFFADVNSYGLVS